MVLIPELREVLREKPAVGRSGKVVLEDRSQNIHKVIPVLFLKISFKVPLNIAVILT